MVYSEGTVRNLTVAVIILSSFLAISLIVSVYLGCRVKTSRNATAYTSSTRAIYTLARSPTSDNNENEVRNMAEQTVGEDDDHLLCPEEESVSLMSVC